MEHISRYGREAVPLIELFPDWAFDQCVYVNVPDDARDHPFYSPWLDYEEGCSRFIDQHVDISEVHFWKVEPFDPWQHHFEYDGEKYILGIKCTIDGDECQNEDGNSLYFQPQWLEHDDQDVGPEHEWKLLAAIHYAIGFTNDRLQGAKSW